MTNSLGKFHQYKPVLAKDHPLARMRAQFLKNEMGRDWYEVVKENSQHGARTYVCVDDQNIVCSIANDISMLFPENLHVIIMPELEYNDVEMLGKKLVGNEFVSIENDT